MTNTLSKMGYDGILESNDGICRYPMIIDTEDISEKKGHGIVVLYNGHGISSSEYQVHLSNGETWQLFCISQSPVVLYLKCLIGGYSYKDMYQHDWNGSPSRISSWWWGKPWWITWFWAPHGVICMEFYGSCSFWCLFLRESTMNHTPQFFSWSQSVANL